MTNGRSDLRRSASESEGHSFAGRGPIGRAGSKEEIRNVAGGLSAAREMFEELSRLGRRVDDPRYAGEAVELPMVGRVGFRAASTRGDREPTIDVYATIDGMRIDKIKFTEQ